MSKFIKIRSPTRKFKIPHFSLVFPLPSAPQMVESEKMTLSSQFLQVPETPTNFHCPSTSRSTELSKALYPPPNSPKESGSSPVTSITFLRHLLILPTKFHPDLSHSKKFPRFPGSPSIPHPNVTRSGQGI